MRKTIKTKYKTVSQLIAHESTQHIAICSDGKNFYVHERNTIYDFINPMSSYKNAFMIDSILCIVV